MRVIARLEGLDRRWLYVILGLLVVGPLLWPLYFPLEVSAPVRGFHDAIERVPNGSLILMSCDYDPATRPEMVPMTMTAMRQLFDKHCRVVVTVLWNGGPGIVDETLRRVAAEYPDKKYGVDWVNLGYKSGNEAVMVLMGQGIANAYPVDYTDHRTTDYTALPIMRDVRDYSSFPLLVSISAGYPGTKEWVQQVNSRFHLPMISGSTAVQAPEFYPYLQAGQIQGLLGGMSGAAEYEKLRHEKGTATRGMDAQSLAHVFIALCIVLGNVVQWSKRREARA